jgi:hypothetical protein
MQANGSACYDLKITFSVVVRRFISATVAVKASNGELKIVSVPNY